MMKILNPSSFDELKVGDMVQVTDYSEPPRRVLARVGEVIILSTEHPGQCAMLTLSDFLDRYVYSDIKPHKLISREDALKALHDGKTVVSYIFNEAPREYVYNKRDGRLMCKVASSKYTYTSSGLDSLASFEIIN